MRIIVMSFIVLSLVALGWMLIAYIPSYVKIFDALGGKLPFITVLMVTMSQFTQVNLIIAMAVITIGLGGLHYATKENDQAFIVIGSIMIVLCLLLTGLGYLAVQAPLNELKRATGKA